MYNVLFNSVYSVAFKHIKCNDLRHLNDDFERRKVE